MKKIFFLFTYLFLLNNLYAQEKTGRSVKGILIDSLSGIPVSYGTVRIQPETSSASRSATANKDGYFEIHDLSQKPSVVIISSSGYTPRELNIQVWPGTQITDLGKILLSPQTRDLKGVVVTGNKPLVKQEIDRLSYDVQADPESKAQTVMELLRKVPLISVDGDDNIQLQGSTGYRIFINGKPSPMMASNVKDALRAMPAANVQKIEVITTPPAKYDSEGLAGIINIILNKRTDNGYNATVSARHSLPFGSVFNVTSAAKQGKWGLTFSAARGLSNEMTITSSNLRKTYAPASLFEQSVQSTSDGSSWFGNAELSFEADSLNLFTINGYTSSSRSWQSDLRNTTFTTESAGGQRQVYQLQSDMVYPWHSEDIGINYQRGFKKNAQQLLTFSYRYNSSINNQFVNTAAKEKQHYELPDNKQQNATRAKEHTLQLDYVHPFKSVTMEAGVKAIIRNNSSLSEVQYLLISGTDSVYTEDPSRANDFQYLQDVLSVYNTYNWVQGAYTIKAGARMEHTLIDASFRTTNTALHRQYSNFTPSVSVMRNLKNKQSLTFGFSSRIERPGISLLNPFTDKSNPQIQTTGNPDLKAVQSYQGEISYLRTGKGTLNIRTSYLYSSGNITSVVRILSDSTSETTYDNIGKNAILRLGINGNYPLGKFSLNFNTGAFYVWVSGPYNGRFYRNKGIRTNSFANITYRPGNNWTVGLNAGYNRRYITLQGSSDDYAYYSVSGSRSFLDKRLSLTIILNNFGKRNYTFTQYSSTPDFYQSNTRNGFYRNSVLSVSYKFGKLSGSIKKNKRGISNDDVNNGG